MQNATYDEPARRLTVAGTWDVIVAGGSQSGVAAAVSAARHGASVLLVERNCFLGGQSVATMVVQWEKRAFINNLGAVATRGIAREMVDKIVSKGGSDALWTDPPGCEEMRDGEEWLDVEAIKTTMLELCLDARVQLLLDTLVAGTMTDGTGKVTGIIVENASGRLALQAKVVVDATAYLDVAWHAGGDAAVFTRPVAERMTPGWYTVFDGVDSRAFITHLLEHGGASGYPSLKNPAKVRHHLDTGRLLLYRGFAATLDDAFERGLLDRWPDGLSLPFTLNVKWWGGSRWCTSLDPFDTLDALDGFALSGAEVRRQLIDWIMLGVFRLLPGWQGAYLSRTATRLGLRETRILKASTMLARGDVFEPDHDRADAVGRSGAHDPGKNRLWQAYPVPYGIMVPARIDGLLCASRTIGAADKTALDAHRGIVPTIVVGQAAGTAAAMAALQGIEPRDVDVAALRDMLRADGVVLDVETVDLPTIPPAYRDRGGG